MQAKEALAVLVASFRQEKIEPETIKVYVKHLQDIPGPLLDQTISHLVRGAKFFPSIAEIRETAAGLCGLLPVSPAEALAIVKQADVAEPKYDRAGRYCYTERYWQFPKGLASATGEAIHAALASVGDPYDANGKAKFGWEQGFSKSYETHAEESKRYVLANLKTLALLAPTRKAVSDGGLGEPPAVSRPTRPARAAADETTPRGRA